MARYRVVLKYSGTSFHEVEMKVDAETVSDHLVYMFDPILTLVPNGDGTGTTDWVDTNVDGLGDDWTVDYGNY